VRVAAGLQTRIDLFRVLCHPRQETRQSLFDVGKLARENSIQFRGRHFIVEMHQPVAVARHHAKARRNGWIEDAAPPQFRRHLCILWHGFAEPSRQDMAAKIDERLDASP